MPELARDSAPPAAPGPRVCLFTDTLGDVNGVSRFIRTMGEFASAAGCSFNILTSTNIPVPHQPYIHNFRPLFATTMPGYSHLEVAAPPAGEMKRAARVLRPDVIHVSTPGPVGVVGARIARALKTPLVGTYHTDFPAFVDDLLQDPVLTRICREVMSRFYGKFSRVLTRSHEYIPRVGELGVPPQRVLPLTPGCDHGAFDRSFRDVSIWRGLGVDPAAVKVLSCGRVSVEKNLPLLTRVWRAADRDLRDRGANTQLVVIGDGPYLAEMKRELAGTNTVFVGYRFGRELSTIYASGDLLVFPSLTDTLGQVVLEAQCSGLPAVVSDIGGPKEIVRDGVSGIVVPARAEARWVRAVVELVTREGQRRAMSESAYQHSRGTSFQHSFEHFWRIHDAAWREGPLRRRAGR